MTEEERIAATEDAVHELEDKRESKQAAKRESRISTTRDIRATLDAIENEVCPINRSQRQSAWFLTSVSAPGLVYAYWCRVPTRLCSI